jgi:hypothetical protein
MKPVPEEWESLRLAANAADRERAAEQLRPAFEKRLKELGYSPLAISHAFTTLTGPGTVAEALAELAENARLERDRRVVLNFEPVEQEPGLPPGHSLTIDGVERDGWGIRIRYTIRPPLSPPAGTPQSEGRDDRGREYAQLGGFYGLAETPDPVPGMVTMPFPHPDASSLRVRISWSGDPVSLWDRPALELRVTL